jgi:Ran GTPase-activating protein (RanGAP) involved in mRNA processing and transport
MPFDQERMERISSNDPSLTELVVSISTDHETMALANALSSNTVLRKLDLRYSNLSGGRAKKLFATTSSLLLDSLLLCNCRIESAGVKDLAESSFGRSVTSLDLRYNEIGDDGAGYLSEAMMAASTTEDGPCRFQSLILGNCLISNDGAKSIAEALGRKDNFMKELDLRENQIGDDGAAALAQALTIKQGLLTLDLRENQIGNKGAQSIANALSNQSTLTDLNLSDNQIGNEGAQSLAGSLTLNTQLKRLLLYANLIGDSGAKSFLHSMQFNDSLTHLDLSRNAADKNLRQEIVKIIEANRRCARKKKERPKPQHNYDCFGIMDGIIDSISGTTICGSSGLPDEQQAKVAAHETT